jgi:hypothetical protein
MQGWSLTAWELRAWELRATDWATRLLWLPLSCGGHWHGQQPECGVDGNGDLIAVRHRRQAELAEVARQTEWAVPVALLAVTRSFASSPD